MVKSSKEVKTFITTIEGNRYTLPDDKETMPRVYAVAITIGNVLGKEYANYYFGNYGSNSAPSDTLFIEESTLQKAGLKPYQREDKVSEPTETVEDLILRLLEQVGVYPQQ